MTDGTTTWNYIYDANGMRTQRSNGTTVYNYVYNGSSLSQMTVGSNTLYFSYDASGIPMSLVYNGTNYYYIVNLQGDVMGIVDSTGTLVVYYTYDAWGKPLSVTGSMANTLGTTNPLRYRGYVYDEETALYYLQSRYYDSEIGRFINADAFVSTGQGIIGNNMFAYCGNNPVMGYDPSGHMMVYQKLLGGYGGYAGGGIGAGDLLAPLVVGTVAVLGALYETTKKAIKRMSKALVDTAKVRYENSQPAIHHVVPQGCLCDAAQKSRNILKENSISVQGPINLVIINYETHKQLHSSKHGYCNWVYTILSANEDNARGGLAIIKTAIAMIALGNGSYCIGIW